MTPQEFVAKWSKIQQKETAVSQSHFNDICALVGHLPPLEFDPEGDVFPFETQTVKPGGQKGFAEVPAQCAKETRKSVTRPQIQELDDIHRGLDTAVLDTYSWPHNLTDEEILERLLALNLERAKVQEEN